jgi:hypothetical protein
MIDNDDIQAGLVAYLQAQTTTIVALLDSSGDIKEDQWQGTTFLYPAVRVDLGPQLPKANCDAADVTFSVLCYSENASSKEADELAGTVNTDLHRKAFTKSSVRYSIYSQGLIPAIREDDRTWRSEATFHATVEPG